MTKFVEENIKEHLRMRYQITETLFSGKSDFQKVEVVQTTGYGKMLLNDDLVMLTERDEFVYHDMIAHVPMFIHPNPKNVLIIGGGDGGTAREVLRHDTVEKVTMVEIDKMVVDACIEHIPLTSSELNKNPKLHLKIEDGVKFAKDIAAAGKEKFDVILIDSTDPIGPAQPLFGDEFYKDIYNCLAEDGIVVSQGESCHYEAPMQKKLMNIIYDRFAVTSLYNFHNLTYPGGLWSFTFASKGLHPIKDFNPKRVEDSKLEFEYYNPGVHVGAFELPTFQKKNVGEYIKA